MPFSDRAVAAFLGLAVGDAYGRPLEFVRGSSVRTKPVDVRPGKFIWTDDTHMALYLGQAVLDLPDRAFDDDALGHAIGKRFVEWEADPFTPSTAPGNTCLAGAKAYRQSRDWRTSGVARSQGCGSVMRIAPLPMAFGGDALTRAADISSRVTHAHPNAIEAAIAGSHLLRALLVGGRPDERWVRDAIAGLRGPWSRGGDVAQSLKDALAHPRDAQWLAEQQIHPGDGGWMAGSALGLAVAAVLAWGDDVRVAIDRAARIDGDSDSVACLVGMFLGAAGMVLPAEMVSATHERAKIESLARLLSTQPAPAGLRTSATDPIRVDQVHADPSGGRLGVTFAPGKRDRHSSWHRDLDADLDRLVHADRVEWLISLIEDHELDLLGIPRLVAEADARGLRIERFPIKDVSTPTDPAAAWHLARRAADEVRAGRHVVFHCRGGLGRAGTMAACVLVELGVEPAEAIRRVRSARPKAIETDAQERFVHGR